MTDVKRGGWILLAIAALPGGVRADAVEWEKDQVRVRIQAPRIEGKQITLGLTDSIRITYQVARTAGQEIKLGPWTNPKEVWRIQEDPPNNSGAATWEQTLTVQPWKPGKFALSLPAALVADRAGVAWEELSVQVETRFTEAVPPLREIPGFETVLPRDPPRHLSWWLLGFVPVLLVPILIWLLLRNRLRGRVREDFLARTLEELAHLGDATPATHAEMEGCFAELSRILRDFTEQRLAVSGKTKTSAEWLAAVLDKGTLPEPAREFLRDFLETCDRIRFAAILPSLDEYRATVVRVKWFVGEEWRTQTTNEEPANATLSRDGARE
jgi:hypothetical protein